MHAERLLPTRSILLSVIGLFFLLALLTYGESLESAFVRWDDGLLIFENPAIRAISPQTLWAIFTHYDPELYIPLTFLSYQFDYLLGGTNPLVYHAQNLLYHTLNALLVAGMLHFLLRRGWIALFGGLLFLLHPLHTEAVVWASARKDVLSTFFFLASLLSWFQWKERGGRRLYWLSVACFLLGLLSKVMVITLPVVFLLYEGLRGNIGRRKMWVSLLPFLTLAILFAVIAVIGKQDVLDQTTPFQMILMAMRSVVFYLQKFLIPEGFSVLYPSTGDITLSSPAFFFPPIILTMVTVALATWHRSIPLLWYGWMFYLITLIPTFTNFAKGVDDFFVGSDRYAYIPSIGLILMLCIGFAFLLDRYDRAQHWLAGAGILILGILLTLSFRQSRVWANSETLFLNVIEHHPDSYIAHNNLANYYRMHGLIDEALSHYNTSLGLRERAITVSNIGFAHRSRGNLDDAVSFFQRSLLMDPRNKAAHLGLGMVAAQRGDAAAAETAYRRALEIDPDFAEALNNLGVLLIDLKRIDEAREILEHSLTMNPLFPSAFYNLGLIYEELRMQSDAEEAYIRTIALDPHYTPARINLGILLHGTKRPREAEAQFRAVLDYDPDNKTALGALQQMGALSRPGRDNGR